jgi:hypothetical protein
MNAIPQTTPWVIELRGSIEGSNETTKKRTPVIRPGREIRRVKTLGRGISSVVVGEAEVIAPRR